MNGGIDFPPEMVDYRGPNYTGGGVTAKTYVTSVSMSPSYDSENAPVLSNNSVQPEWRSNYRGDYKGSVRPICTTDLLTWAFQVSRGMEYLASRKVMHGDLAARNILLADNNIVKICDFGLAKSMYKNDNYKKKGDGPLPVKWMAIESIRDRVFSTQSDVWSFGIVLWEFCSLARTPYPGMEADERLYNKLIDGYRMESPEFAPKELYKMMLDCWQPRPTSRPSFTRLAERIGCMLEDSVRKHYIDLNDPYLVMNTRRLEDGHSDYLMMLSPPNFDQLSSPRHYTNSPNSPNSPAAEEATPGYLCMKPSIFSPRAEDERIFDFSTSSPPPRTKTKSAESTDGTELLPMLGVLSVPESDSDSTPASPAALSPTSFANPSYHLPPKVTAAPRDDDSSALPKEPHVTKDNYVNMPQNKSAKGAEMNNNPFSSDIQEKDINRHYVNSNSRDWEAVTV